MFDRKLLQIFLSNKNPPGRALYVHKENGCCRTLSFIIQKDFTPTSHRFHMDFNAFFYFYSIKRKKTSSNKGGNDDVFRFGMVLVAFDCGGAYPLYPVQGKVHEMVEQTGAGQEKETAWEMGG